MSKCLSGITKKRHSNTGKGNPGNYKRSIRGHTWLKLIKKDVHIGRTCTKCHKTVLNPRGI